MSSARCVSGSVRCESIPSCATTTSGRNAPNNGGTTLSNAGRETDDPVDGPGGGVTGEPAPAPPPAPPPNPGPGGGEAPPPWGGSVRAAGGTAEAAVPSV